MSSAQLPHLPRPARHFHSRRFLLAGWGLIALAVGSAAAAPRPATHAAVVRQLRVQAAVLGWAQGQSWLQAALLEPRDPKPRERAGTLLDDAIERLRSVVAAGDRTALGDNLRFRLAQALADRAELEAAGS